MSFAPVTDIKEVDVVVGEDADYELIEWGLGLEHLLGIDKPNLHLFPLVDTAYAFLKTSDRSRQTVVLLDNQTPPSTWNGFALAQQLLREKDSFPNLIVVTVTSSDVAIALEEDGKRLSQLQKLGGEFWSKHQEDHLCLLWLGECLRTGEVIPRAEWLTGLGVESKFKPITDNDLRTLEDWAIYRLTDRMRYPLEGQTPETILEAKGLTEGDFFRLEASEVLAKLGFQGRGVEGRPNRLER